MLSLSLSHSFLLPSTCFRYPSFFFTFLESLLLRSTLDRKLWKAMIDNLLMEERILTKMFTSITMPQVKSTQLGLNSLLILYISSLLTVFQFFISCFPFFIIQSQIFPFSCQHLLPPLHHPQTYFSFCCSLFQKYKSQKKFSPFFPTPKKSEALLVRF